MFGNLGMHQRNMNIPDCFLPELSVSLRFVGILIVDGPIHGGDRQHGKEDKEEEILEANHVEGGRRRKLGKKYMEKAEL